MALTTFVLHHWLPFPPVIDNDCVGDCRLCVFPLDVEVVGEGVAVYLFGQAVVAGREVELADMAIDGGGVVGGYGTQDGSEAELLKKFIYFMLLVFRLIDLTIHIRHPVSSLLSIPKRYGQTIRSYYRPNPSRWNVASSRQ